MRFLLWLRRSLHRSLAQSHMQAFTQQPNWADDIEERMRRMLRCFWKWCAFQSLNDKRFVMRFSCESFFHFDFIVSHTILGVHCEFTVIHISFNDDNRHRHTNWCIRLQTNKNARIDIINSVIFIRKSHCFCSLNWIITIHKVGDVKLNGVLPEREKNTSERNIKIMELNKIKRTMARNIFLLIAEKRSTNQTPPFV